MMPWLGKGLGLHFNNRGVLLQDKTELVLTSVEREAPAPSDSCGPPALAADRTWETAPTRVGDGRVPEWRIESIRSIWLQYPMFARSYPRTDVE